MMKWKKKKLSEFCEFSNGLWTGKKPPFQKVGVIRNTNFTKDCLLDDSDIVYLDVEQSQFQKRKLQYGDIILEKSGGGPKQPVGRVVIFDKTEGDFSFSNFTSVIRIKNKDEVDFNFLHRYLLLEYISGATEKMQSHSTGIRNLKFDEYKGIEIPIPPIHEQQRIVSILDEAFAAIAKIKANAEQNLKNAKELFESYLQGVFVDSTGSPTKRDGWEEKRIDEICKLINGRAYKKDELLNKGKYRVLRVGNFFTSEHWYYSDLELDEDKYCDKEDLLYAWSASFGPRIWKEEKVIYHYHIWKVIPDKNLVTRDFLFTLFEWDKEKIKAAQGTGTTMIHVSKGSMENRIVPVPPLKEQQTIVRQLNALRAETQKLEAVYQKKMDDLEELKKSILQKAFAGELKTSQEVV